MITTVLFDLDGTLLPMNQDEFVKTYMGLLAKKFAPLGYEPEKLIQAVWKGTEAMVRNDGTCTNEKAFWNYFSSVYGENSLSDIPKFEEFYRGEFQSAASSCGFNEQSASLIHELNEKGFRVILATNPLFPSIATENRIRWAGLKPEDFELYTTYENCSFCKPNPEYYREILDSIGCQPEECLMVGNDVDEDMIAETLGMKVFLLTDCLLNRHDRDLSAYPQGDFRELQRFLFS